MSDLTPVNENQNDSNALEGLQKSQTNINVDNLNEDVLTQLTTANRKPINLEPQYWSPEGEGEQKRLIYLGCKMSEIPSFDDPNIMIDKMTAHFLEVRQEPNEETGELEVKGNVIVNASSRLVCFLLNPSNGVIEGNVYDVIYTGKKKNKTNNNMSARWEFYTVELEGKNVESE